MSTSGSTSVGTSEGGADAAGSGLAVKLAAAWTFVGIPLAYGIFQTVKRAAALFTG